MSVLSYVVDNVGPRNVVIVYNVGIILELCLLCSCKDVDVPTSLTNYVHSLVLHYN